MNSRRMFLRAAGATLWLPFLPSAAPRPTWASAPQPPARLVLGVVPNGIVASEWEPDAVGEAYALTRLLEPIAKLRDRFLILSGVENLSEKDVQAMHEPAMASLTTDTPLVDATVIHNGISVDQVYADEVGDYTPLRSLQLGVDNGALSTEGSLMYDETLSWAGGSTPLPPELDPVGAFDRLFGSTPSDPTVTALKTSVLDRVLERSADLKRGLSSADQDRLDQYETGVRELEQRLAFLDSVLCSDPDAPASGLPFELATDAMYDLILIALQCDLTRSITFLQGPTESFFVHRHLGVTETHHVLSHSAYSVEADMEDLLTIQTWEIDRFVRFVDRLATTVDVDGTDLLSNTLSVFTTEFSESNSHVAFGAYGLPIAVAGGESLGVRSGRHQRFTAENIGNFWLAVLGHLGTPQATFGAHGQRALSLT